MMGNLLRICAVLTAVVMSAASATAPPPARRGQELVDVPALVRTETVATEKAIDGFEINAKPAGAAGWSVGVRNNTDSVATILLDESSFVASTGMAGGRLISGSTRKMDTAKAQPGTPVPPGAAILEMVFVEKLVGSEESESEIAKLAEKYGGVTPRIVRSVETERKERAALIVGGKLYLTIQSSNGKQTWTGAITDGTPAAAPEPAPEPAP